MAQVRSARMRAPAARSGGGRGGFGGSAGGARTSRGPAIGGPHGASQQSQAPGEATEVDAVLDLQESFGNRAVVQLLAAEGRGAPLPVLRNSVTVGNRAVAQLLAATPPSPAPIAAPAVQRAPNDDDRSGATSYPAGDSGATSYPAGDSGATSYPAGSHGPSSRSAGPGGGDTDADDLKMLPDPKVVVPVGGGAGPKPEPQQVPTGYGGGIDVKGRGMLMAVPNPVIDAKVRRQYAEDPASVFRSPSVNFHNEMWRQMRTDAQPEEPPIAFAAGRLIAVHPRYPGPATPIPGSYSGRDDPAAVVNQVATMLDRTAPKPGRPMMNAFAPPTGGAPGFGGTPGSVAGPQGPGRQTAVAVSTPDILAALKADPNAVKRSPSQGFHDDMFRADLGQGSTVPTAFRVGNQILVSPNHPIRGVRTLEIPGGATGGGAGAPGAPGAPGAGAANTTAGGTSGGGRRWKGDASSMKGSPGIKGELGVEDETIDGDTKRTKGKGAVGSIGGGKGLVVGGQTTDSQTTGDATTANKKQATLTIDPSGALVLGTEKSKATYKGTKESGEPIKTGEVKTNKSLGLSEKGLIAKAGAERETAGGHKIGASGSLTMDGKGNISGEGSLKFESKGGTSLTPSISGGISVQASDPIPSEGGGFDVSYTITSSSGVGLGAGKQFGGGPSIGIQLGSTSGSLDTGTRHFDDIKKAQAFRDKAAEVIAGERFLPYPPPNTVEGALLIPIGEERGTGDFTGKSYGGSVAFQGASLGYGESSSTTHQFKVRRTRDKVVHVTGSVTGTKGSEVTGSGIISLGRGDSNTRGFEVVWELDLGTKAGRDSFELYAKTGMPPLSARLVSMTSSGSDSDHDSVTIPLLGTAKWTGTTWELIREDARGRHAQFGGKQSRDQDPSWIGKNVFGQDTIKQNSQITSKLDTDTEGNQAESYEAEIKVSGTEGDETRRELGQIWSGVRTAGKVKPSGEWTLSATVSTQVVRDLEKVNDAMRAATTREDKMRVYSALVKEHGIRMVGAQVGMGGDPLAWSLELKGDKNFPGPSGRAALDSKRAELRGRLKDPKAAKGVVSEAQTTLDLLKARRLAVADRQRYTDLPDGLRDQQLKLIDKHISDFEFIRHQALRAALKVEAPAAKADAAKAAKAGKPDAAGAEGYKGNNEAAESAAMLKLRADIDAKETAISAIDPRINRLVNALTQASKSTVDVDPRYGGWVLAHRTTYQQHWDLGSSLNERQFAMAPKIDALRQDVLERLFEADRRTAAEQLRRLLTDRLDLLEALHMHLKMAAEALKPITTPKGMRGYPKFWASINGDEPPWIDPYGSSED